MRRILSVLLAFCALMIGSATLNSCAKSGCPANEAIYNSQPSNQDPTKKMKKPPKTSSGITRPEGKSGKKY